MNHPPGGKNRRILVIDDNRAIHRDFRKILAHADTGDSSALTEAEAELFGPQPAEPKQDRYEVDSAYQGDEGLLRVSQALEAGRPYAMAFVDVRMPPGWDGVETTRRIWAVDPSIQIVICTAYSDYSWDEMFSEIGDSDGLLILKKPFDSMEALQLAHALTEKWWLNLQSRGKMEELEILVAGRTRELMDSNNAMRESAALLRIAGHVARLGGWSIDLPSTRLSWSDEVCAIHDVPPGTMPDMDTALDFFVPESRQVIAAAIDSCASEGAPFDIELELESATGRKGWVRAIGEARRDADGAITRLQGALQDITDRKKLEQQFLRAQRMESIGTLAGGIAHDLNNVLAPIMMSIELLKLEEDDPWRLNILSIIGGSAKRGADMVEQVLSFARGIEGRQMEVRPAQLLREVEDFARETFPKNIEVIGSAPAELWSVHGDATQLHQVLLNLCVNARDAMPDGGTLTLTAENLKLDAQYAGMKPGVHPGPCILLQVEDTGTGMPPELIARIFDPFFTTKEVGKGTGLGLSTSLAIVRSHGGFIQVYSELGKGTRFKIYLPGQLEPGSAAPVPVIPDAPRGQGELILVVDDEAPVRLITRHTLETFGYRVVVAADGAEAIAIYASRHAEISAVLTDMMMPAMDGPATIPILKHINPAVRIIAASGLSASTAAAKLGVHHFLPKPYTAEMLLKMLRDLLGE